MTIATKKPLNLSLPRAIRERVQDGKQLSGQAWPCTVAAVDGAIVTVVFEVSSDFTLPQVTCPIAEPFYIRIPVQVGDQGMVMAASTRLGGVTGLGAGLAPLSEPSNLGGLVFVPLGNKNWATIDPNAVVINAPNGAKLRTFDGASIVTIDTDQVKIQQGDVTVEITGGVVTVTADRVVVNATDSTFNGDVIVNGNATVSENLEVGGNAAVAGAVSCATMACVGLGEFGSLTVGGKPYASHDHLPGTYQAGSTHITGVSGVVGP